MPPEHVEAHIDKVGEHGAKWLRSKYASWFLAVIAFAESVFAPILIDPFLVAMILAKREKWIQYSVIAIIASIAGGIVAYILGSFFFDVVGNWLVDTFNVRSQFESIAANLASNGFVFVLIGAVTPIPYKLVALASGFVHVDLITFVVASVFGRILRLGLVGYAAYAAGPHALPLFRKHFLKLAYVFMLLLVAYIIFQFVV